MPITLRFRSALAAAASLALAAVCTSCGSDTVADPYNGIVFASDGAVFGLDSRMLASTDRTTCNPTNSGTCGQAGQPPCVGFCYPVQVGYANGKPIQFYNMDPIMFWSATTNVPSNCNSSSAPCTVAALQSRNLPDAACATGASCVLPAVAMTKKNQDATGGSHADFFPNSCTPDRSYDPRTDEYKKLSQGPIFDSLPLATSNTSFTAIVYPIVATYGVTGITGMTCNDLKDSRSIGSKDAPGKFGSVRTDSPTSYQMWPVIDPTAEILKFDTGLSTPVGGTFDSSVGWYKGLQVRYMDGGRIPTKIVTDGAGNQITSLVVMDAAIVNPTTGFSAVTAQKAIIFPAAPGDDAWSPLVRLHNFALPSGKKIGDYNGICQAGQTCPASYIPAASIAVASFNTLFIVAPPQQ
jgi:hypothetical protein